MQLNSCNSITKKYWFFVKKISSLYALICFIINNYIFVYTEFLCVAWSSSLEVRLDTDNQNDMLSLWDSSGSISTFSLIWGLL